MESLNSIVKQLGSAINDVRDDAFDRVAQLMRCEEAQQWKEIEFMKLWKGLFYGMWNLDGELNQLERAERISDCLLDGDVAIEIRCALWRAFLVTLGREWITIDQYRLDKYYALARKMLYAVFKVSLRTSWSHVEFFVAFEEEVLSCTSIPSGIPSHFVEIYVEELDKACRSEKVDELDQRAFVCLLHPFVKMLAATSSHQTSFKKKITSTVLDAMQREFEDRIHEKSFQAAVSLLDLDTFLKMPKHDGLFDANAVAARDKLRGPEKPAVQNKKRETDASLPKTKKQRNKRTASQTAKTDVV